MKNAILITLMMFFAFAKAQDGIALTVIQDGRLLLLGDDRGNEALTPNIIARVELQGLQRKVGYLVVPVEYEYADLSGGTYHRYSAGVGYTFNYMPIPMTDKVFELSFLAQYGMIVRFGGGTFDTFVFSNDIAFKVSDRLKLTVSHNLTNRNDLKWRWGTGGFQYSLGAGIKFQITK